MPPKKATTSSPYFSSPGTRKSTRVSATASASAKKRPAPDPASSASENESEFDDGGDESSASASDFEEENEKVDGRGRKRVKRDQDYESAPDNKDDQDEDEEEDSEDDEAKPVRVTVIPLPKLRDEGEIEYEDAKIHENTMLFLKDLKKNNNREWMRCEICPALLFRLIRDLWTNTESQSQRWRVSPSTEGFRKFYWRADDSCRGERCDNS